MPELNYLKLSSAVANAMLSIRHLSPPRLTLIVRYDELYFVEKAHLVKGDIVVWTVEPYELMDGFTSREWSALEYKLKSLIEANIITGLTVNVPKTFKS